MENNLEETMEIKIENQKNSCIKNKELKKLVSYKLGKNDFKEADLATIQDIIIDEKTISGSYNEVFFDEIKLFTNLKEIKIRNCGISLENIKELINIEKITFEKCVVEDITPLKDIKYLSIINTRIGSIDDIKEFKELEHIELIDIEVDNYGFLRALPNLKELAIKNISNLSWNKINFYLPIEYLSIEGIESISMESIDNFDNLKTLSIEIGKQKVWQDDLLQLKDKGIKILLDDIYEY